MFLCKNWPSWCLLLVLTTCQETKPDDEYNVLHKDGSYEFGYETPDSYHHADANRKNIVRGEFGSRNPATASIDSTVYTAGPRGFRPRGKNIARKYDLSQNGPRPLGSKDDPYFDPYEDPSYSFGFRTRTYDRQETANRVGDVSGKYSYLDDVGERHNVEFIAGKNTGFHVKTPYPDSNPRTYGPLYFRGRGKPIPRGRTSIQRGLDGSYRFVSAGPDQRRTETSDSTGHVRGSYTYLDDKGIQHSVHYIAGPETGYRVLKNVKGPHLPTIFPFGRPDIIPPDFYNYDKETGDVFDTAASGHVKPINPNKNKDKNKPPLQLGDGININREDQDQLDDLNKTGSSTNNNANNDKIKPTKPDLLNNNDYDDSDDIGDDLFGPSAGSSSKPSSKPKPQDDGSYKPTGNDGSYKPESNQNLTPSKPNLTGLGGSTSNSNQPGGSISDLAKPGGATTSLGRPQGSPPNLPKPGGYQDDYNDNNDVNDNLGVFDSIRPSPIPDKPIIQVGISNQKETTNGNCRLCQGTLVKNLGDQTFSVPPGASVRAHVQSIDLLPLHSKIPSPSEQYKAEMSVKTEQLNEASNNLINNDTVQTTTESIITTTLEEINATSIS